MSLTVLALLLLSYSLAFTTFSVHAEPGAHARILIDGNSQFTPGNGVVSGSGSAADPYIIANWEIDASAGDGIKVANTDAHFVIRNCAISGGIPGFPFESIAIGAIAGAIIIYLLRRRTAGPSLILKQG